MDEVRVPMYLVSGFLESGKTTFLKFTISEDYFQIDEPTLLIVCEQGLEEYDEKELLKYKTVMAVIEEQEDLTPQKLVELERNDGIACPYRIINIVAQECTEAAVQCIWFLYLLPKLHC